MTIGKDNAGRTVITLDKGEETRQFALGTKIINPQFTRKGIVETVVQTGVACPSLTTRVFLRDVMEERKNPNLVAHLRTARVEPANATMGNVLAAVRACPSDEYAGTIEADLARFVTKIDASVPISEVLA